MSELPPERPKRRVRYAGKNPRKFAEKYKEHAPERYAEDVEKVLAGGKTPAGTHRPIMVREIIEVLAPQPGETAVDCTLGYGGHAREILAAIQPGGRLIALDADPIELPKTEARLRALGIPAESLLVRRMNFAGLAQLLATEAPGGADTILADLGVSSMQIDNPARGFTFKSDGPLDLRMNPARGQSAAALLAGLSAPKLEKLLIENADEPHAAPLARAISQAHDITTTTALAALVRTTLGEDAELSVRRVFQALRIAVNDEFGALDTFLRNLPQCLKPGGRVAILTFHSGEDRRVKHAFKTGERDGIYAEIAHDIVRPGADEQRANPRSASAKLRWARPAARRNEPGLSLREWHSGFRHPTRMPYRPSRREPMNYYVTSFINILHFISDDLIQVDSTTRIAEIFGDEFDDLDFELALCCFEATHKVSFAARLWESEADDYEELTIEEFIEAYVEGGEQRDPLFVTKRFMMYQESLTKALTEEAEEPPDEY